MKYNDKKEFIETIEKKIMDNQSISSIKEDLKKNGLYEYDISNLIGKAKRNVGIKIKPIIEENIRSKVELSNVEQLKFLDNHLIHELVNEVNDSINQSEKLKLRKLLKEGQTKDEILKTIEKEYLSNNDINNEFEKFQAKQKQNKGRKNYKYIKIAMGIGLIIFSSAKSLTLLLILGIIWLIHGLFMSETNNE